MPSQHILFDEHSDVNSVFSSSRTSDKGSLLHHKNSFAISPQDCAVAAPQRQDLTLVPSCAGSQLNTCCLRTPWLGDARPQDRRRTNGQRAKNQHLLTLPAPGLPHRNFKTKTSFPSVVKKKKAFCKGCHRPVLGRSPAAFLRRTGSRSLPEGGAEEEEGEEFPREKFRGPEPRLGVSHQSVECRSLLEIILLSSCSLLSL